MIDNFAIILFGLCIVFLAIRAIRLDQALPWFDDIDELDTSRQARAKIGRDSK